MAYATTRMRFNGDWQIFVVGQILFVIYFMSKWLVQRAKKSLLVMALLAGTWLANFAAVYWLT